MQKKRSVKGPSLKDVQRSIREFRNSPMAIIDLQSPQSLGDTELLPRSLLRQQHNLLANLPEFSRVVEKNPQ